jgi:predicted membrane protein
METQKKSIDRRLVAGILLIAAGGLLLLERSGLLSFDIGHFIFSWKTLLIAIGLITISSRENRPTGYILMGLGLLFWMPELIGEEIRFSTIFWPAVLIGVGVMIITRKGDRKQFHFHHVPNAGDAEPIPNTGNNSDRVTDYIDDLAVFGGGNTKVFSENFRGGKITAIFGGSDIDLKNAKPAENCTIDLFVLFGGSKLIVPEDWQIKSEVVAIFGGSTDKRVFPTVKNSEKYVVIKGVVLFGGIEFKSY